MGWSALHHRFGPRAGDSSTGCTGMSPATTHHGATALSPTAIPDEQALDALLYGAVGVGALPDVADGRHAVLQLSPAAGHGRQVLDEHHGVAVVQRPGVPHQEAVAAKVPAWGRGDMGTLGHAPSDIFSLPMRASPSILSLLNIAVPSIPAHHTTWWHHGQVGGSQGDAPAGSGEQQGAHGDAGGRGKPHPSIRVLEGGLRTKPRLGARLHQWDVHKHKAPVHVVLTWGGPSWPPAALRLVHPPRGNQG